MEKVKEKFYRQFVTEVVHTLICNSVLDHLYKYEVLTLQEKCEIRNLETPERRSIFWDIMTTKDYECIIVLIRGMEKYCAGQKSLISEMKTFLGNSDPTFVSKERFDSLYYPPSPLPCPSPPLIHNFVERKLALGKLHELVARPRGLSNSILAVLSSLNGLGGIGKTTLARRYVDYFLEQFPGAMVFWIPSESLTTMETSFKTLAKHYGVLVSRGADLSTEVYTRLGGQTCLFVFDNATELEGRNGVLNFLPTGGAHPKHSFIATSRNTRLVETNRVYNLDVFEDAEAEELVREVVPECLPDSCRQLCTKLGNLPLALQQALAYIRESRHKHPDDSTAVIDYLKRFDANARKMLRRQVYDEKGSKTQRTVYITWQTTLSAIKKQKYGKMAIQLLRCLAYFDPDRINLTYVRSLDLRFSAKEVISSKFRGTVNQSRKLQAVFGLQSPPRLREPGLGYKERVFEAAKLLSTYSMVGLQNQTLSVHRLVQEVVRIRTRRAVVNESMFIDRIVNYIDDCLKSFPNTVEQSTSHGAALYQFYKKHSSSFHGFGQYNAIIAVNNEWLNFVTTEIPNANIMDVVSLIRAMQGQEVPIKLAVVCVKAMGGKDMLTKYVQLMNEDRPEKLMGLETSVRSLNWTFFAREAKDPLAKRLLNLVLFLNGTNIEAKFLSTAFSEEHYVVLEKMRFLEGLGVLQLSGDVIVGRPPPGIDLKPCDAQLIWSFVKQAFQSLELDAQCTLRGLDMLRMLPPEFVNSDPWDSEIFEHLKYVENVRVDVGAANAEMAVKLVYKFDLDRIAIGHAIRFFLNFNFDDLDGLKLLGMSYAISDRLGIYLTVCAKIECTPEYMKIEGLSPLDRAKYLKWSVARAILKNKQIVNIMDFLASRPRSNKPEIVGENTAALKLLERYKLIQIEDSDIVPDLTDSIREAICK